MNEESFAAFEVKGWDRLNRIHLFFWGLITGCCPIYGLTIGDMESSWTMILISLGFGFFIGMFLFQIILSVGLKNKVYSIAGLRMNREQIEKWFHDAKIRSDLQPRVEGPGLTLEEISQLVSNKEDE